MENVIQFVANYKGWKAIKKLKVKEKTEPKAIMEFLASLGTGIDSKVEENLRKAVELEKLDSALAELPQGKSSEEIAETLSQIESRKISRVINEICRKPELQKNEQKEIAQFCKAYALRKALKQAGIMVDYSEIEIPALKRIKKKKV